MSDGARADVVAQLAAEIGPDKVRGDALDDYAVDAWPAAVKWNADQRAQHLPAAAVLATSRDDVIACLRIAQRAGRAVVPVALRSGVTGASIPAGAGAVALDVSGLDEIHALSIEDGWVTVSAGINGGRLEDWLNERGLTLGHYPQSLHISSVGGWVATRSSGTYSAKYGGIEHLVAGLDVVLADGTEVSYAPTVRAAAGPDLMQAFLGSEGCLGVVVAVTLRVARLPEVTEYTAYALPSTEDGLGAVHDGFDRHVVPALLRLYDDVEAAHLYERVGRDDDRPLLVVGHEGHADLVHAEREAFAAIIARRGGEALGPDIGNAWAAGRYYAEWLEQGNAGADRIADAIEVTAPWSKAMELYDDVRDRARPLCSTVMAHWSHFYRDGAGMYLIIGLQDHDRDRLTDRYAQTWDAVLDSVQRHGGSISHHHGVGLVRADVLPDALGSSFEVLVRLKGALDPDGLLNPGKLGLVTKERLHA